MPVGGFGVIPVGVTRYTYDRAAERVVERQSDPPTVNWLVEPTATQNEAVRQLLTIPGRHDYFIPGAVIPISELWLELDGIRYLLPQRPHYECCVNDTRVQACPTSFSVEGNMLYLWPTPDAQYHVGFIQQERPRQRVPQWVDYSGTFGVDNSKAEQKSIDLLKEWLTPEQRQDYDKHQTFTVIGSVTSKCYRIHPRATFNVEELNDNGNRVRSLCFVPASAYAVGDIMLAQKIMLETREDEVLKIANFSGGPTTPARQHLYAQLAEILRGSTAPGLYRRLFE